MDVEAVDRGHRRVDLVEARLACSPVVILLPIPAERLHPVQGRTLAPVVDGFLLGPAGAR